MTEIYFDKIWHYRLFNIGNQDMMVNNLVIALLMLWVGMRYYKKIISKLHLYVAYYVEEDTTTSHVLQKIVTYMMFFIYGIFVLDLANIPVSTFAFLGGTIALSVGLGAQALMGNFLSGLIVVLEKSLKIGDIVEIDGVIGAVQSIGIRSTIIKTFCGSNIIIPNSNFVHNIFAKLKSHNSLIESKASLEVKIDDKNSETHLREDILKAFGAVDCVINNPKPTIFLIEVSSEKYLYSVYFYPKITEQYNIEHVKDLINKSVKEALSKSAFTLTYPYQYKIKKEK